MKTITEILHHDVSWWVTADDVQALDEGSIEHIQKSITDGYSQGNLNVVFGEDEEQETTGYWQIVNWRNIALGLYHACDNNTEKQRKARMDLEYAWEGFNVMVS